MTTLRLKPRIKVVALYDWLVRYGLVDTLVNQEAILRFGRL